MQVVKFRLFEPRLQPRLTKLEIPGWAGKQEPRRDGAHEHAWHCMLFAEGAQYGIEVFYPFDNELRVTKRNGVVAFEGDFGPAPEGDLQWPPFRAFGENFYTYQILIDIKVAEGFGVRSEPHPRYYTNESDDVPLAVPALIRTNWWPMISFVVFKAPPEGGTHIFRRGEPFMQFLVIPVEPQIVLEEMDDAEAAEREMRGRRIHASRETLAKDTVWKSSTDTIFDGTYRHLLRAAKAKAAKS